LPPSLLSSPGDSSETPWINWLPATGEILSSDGDRMRLPPSPGGHPIPLKQMDLLTWHGCCDTVGERGDAAIGGYIGNQVRR